VTEIANKTAVKQEASSGGGDVGALWLTTQQAIAGRVAHEIRNTLNGVAVNVEVVRSRLARVAAGQSGNGPAYGAQPGQGSLTFAETASLEFERVSAQTEALLALVRPVRRPADVALVAAQLATLLRLVAQRDGGVITVEGTDDGGARTSMDGEAVRLVVAQAMLAALTDGIAFDVRCTVTIAPGEGPRLTMTRTGSDEPIVLPADVARVAGDAGMRTASHAGTGLLLLFPPSRGADD
jgi:signal transduction histidine kinase